MGRIFILWKRDVGFLKGHWYVYSHYVYAISDIVYMLKIIKDKMGLLCIDSHNLNCSYFTE